MTDPPAPMAGSLWNDLVPRVNAERCERCAACLPVDECLARALRRDMPGGTPYPDSNLCFACLACVAACPHGAILPPGKR